MNFIKLKPCPLCGGPMNPSTMNVGGGCAAGDEYQIESFQCENCFTRFLPYDWERVSGVENRRIKVSQVDLMNMRHTPDDFDSVDCIKKIKQ